MDKERTTIISFQLAVKKMQSSSCLDEHALGHKINLIPEATNFYHSY